MNLFNLLFNDIYSTAIAVYFIIIIISVFFAFCAQRKVAANYTLSEDHYFQTNKWLFFISFIVPAIFIGISTSGIDYQQYINIYNEVGFSTLSDLYLEPGYQVINIVLKMIIPNAAWGVGIIKITSLSIVFSSFYMLRRKINLSLAVAAYLCLFYLQSFNLIRIYFAGALLLYGFADIVVNKRYYVFLILNLIAISIHYTSFVGLYILFLFIVFESLFRKFAVTQRVGLISAINIFLVFIIPIALPLITRSVPIFNKYINYLFDGKFGLMQVLFYILPFIAAGIILKHSKDSNKNYHAIFTVLSFAIAMLGYKIGMITRMAIFFSMPFTFTIPTLYNSLATSNMTENYYKNHRIIGKDIWYFIIILYFFIRLVIAMPGLIKMDGLGTLNNIFRL